MNHSMFPSGSLFMLLGALAWPAHSQTLDAKSAIGKLNENPGTVPTAAVILAATSPITLKLKPDKLVYRSGEVVTLVLATPKKGHIRIFYSDAAGRVAPIFPTEEILAEAARNGASVTDVVPAGEALEISGPHSITGISLAIGPPEFGTEKITVVVTDVPIKEDAAILARIKALNSADSAGRLVAALAIRQDVAAKSAVGKVNDAGVPNVLAGLGLETVSITTKP